jgi:hypothetical protein
MSIEGQYPVAVKIQLTQEDISSAGPLMGAVLQYNLAAPVKVVEADYLLAIAKELGSQGEPYRVAAKRAGEYVLREQVAFDEYCGGTLDNPNIVDKEAALFVIISKTYTGVEPTASQTSPEPVPS